MKSNRYIKWLGRHPVILQLLMGLVVLIAVFIYTTHADMNATREVLVTTTGYIKEQCNRYARIELAAETKSLMRMIESSKQVAEKLEEEGGYCTEEILRSYARGSYVSGILLLDADGTILTQYHEEGQAPKEIDDVLESIGLLGTAEHLEKRYATRLTCADGSEVDVAAMAGRDANEIIVVYYHTPLEYIESFNLSVASLLSGYDMNNSGTIVVSKGDEIVASNDTSMIGCSTDEFPILQKIKESSVGNELTHTNQEGDSVSQYFGLMERGRDFYVYSYIPERRVFTSTPRMLLYTIIVYIIVTIIISFVRLRVVQQYREKQLKAQQEYAEQLQNKNEQLSEAVSQADQANAAKSNFLSRMSHDIRTPLNGIIGLLEISEAHPDDAELIRANQKKMRVSADHLLSLINDVLQMSKLESGEIMISHEPLDLNQLSNDVLTIVSQRAAEAGITMEYDRTSDPIKQNWVYGSVLHLRQIFLNIYTNCIKYNKVGGTISTRVECLGLQDRMVTYRWIISDTGIGMSQKFLNHIFDPFMQERSDARSVYQGTGLGMTIVNGLIKKMNGSIEISSKEGEGSTFVITLPFEIAEESNLLQPEHVDEDVDLNGLHLLLAEDNDLNAEIAQTLLEDEGARVTVVTDGRQAVDLFRDSEAGTFDAILMDIMMPVMDGVTATKELRALDRPDAKRIPIIAMTANAFDEDAQKCFEAGMNAHIAKPLQMQKLKQTIQAQLTHRNRAKV